MKIVVIGGSGLIGTKLVNRLRQKAHEVLAASPNSGVNTLTREGLAEALAGAQVVPLRRGAADGNVSEASSRQRHWREVSSHTRSGLGHVPLSRPALTEKSHAAPV